MPEDQKGFTTSYLTTREDYVAFRQAVERAQTPQSARVAARLLGAALVLIGAALLLLQRGGVYDTAAWCALVLVGLFTFSYFDVLKPDLARRQARAAFDHYRRILVAQSISFSREGLTVSTDRYEASLPYSLLYRCVEDKRLFLFYTGMDEVRFLPKRVMSEQECKELSALLTQSLGERFVRQ